MSRLLVSISIVIACAIASPASANTCSEPDGCPWMIFPMSAYVFLLGDIIFTVADIAYARRNMPLEWSIPELIFGAATAAMGGAMLGVALDDPADDLSDILSAGSAAAFA